MCRRLLISCTCITANLFITSFNTPISETFPSLPSLPLRSQHRILKFCKLTNHCPDFRMRHYIHSHQLFKNSKLSNSSQSCLGSSSKWAIQFDIQLNTIAFEGTKFYTITLCQSQLKIISSSIDQL